MSQYISIINVLYETYCDGMSICIRDRYGVCYICMLCIHMSVAGAAAAATTTERVFIYTHVGKVWKKGEPNKIC